MRTDPPFSKITLLHAAIVVAIVLASFTLWRAGRESRTKHTPPAPPVVAAATTPTISPSAATTAMATSPPAAKSNQTFDWFRQRPFAVALESGRHQWTAEDGRAPETILKLAHNDDEVQRLIEENARIKRRQLVYRKEPVFVAVERAKATGEPVRKLTLPAFDGQVLEMEVTRADLAPSGLSGTFAGRIAGRGASLATLAFDQGREAFTVLSPEDGTYLQGHPREPGEIILTSFDPDKYQPLPGGEPIRTNQPLRIAQ